MKTIYEPVNRQGIGMCSDSVDAAAYDTHDGTQSCAGNSSAKEHSRRRHLAAGPGVEMDRVWPSAYSAIARAEKLDTLDSLTGPLPSGLRSLAEVVDVVSRGPCQGVHIDLMDGIAVQASSWGVAEAAFIRSDLKLEFHVMTENGTNDAVTLMNAQPHSRVIVGTNEFLNLNAEFDGAVAGRVGFIPACKADLGVALRPEEGPEALGSALTQLRCVLIMGYEPGDPNGIFMESVLEKVPELVRMRQMTGANFVIKMDGGVQLSDIPQLREIGVDEFVVGREYFRKFPG